MPEQVRHDDREGTRSYDDGSPSQG